MSRPSGLTIVTSIVTVKATIALSMLQERLGTLAALCGPNLAAQIDAFVRREKLGYYPALEFFNGRDAVDPMLIAAVEEIAHFACEYAKAEAHNRLWAAFSRVHVQHVQALAFTLPGVRTQQADALDALAAHLTPNVVKLELVVSLLQKGPAGPGLEKFSAKKTLWWLREAFESVTITDARVQETI